MGTLSARQTRRDFLAATASVLSGAIANSSPSAAGPLQSGPLTWLAFYGVTADEARLATYDIVVLDLGFRGSVAAIADTGTRVCGYVSLGEVRTSDPLFAYVDPAALLLENPNWPGTRRVDIRHPSWRSLVLEKRLPALAARGFTGLMADTLDTASYLEQVGPARYRGMRNAAIELVGEIRARWPEMTLIINRGYGLLRDLVERIDAVIAESFMTTIDGTGAYAWTDSRSQKLQLSLLNPAALRRPPLPILSLDYWEPRDTETIAEIYRRERRLGHHPYVATRALDQIVPEAA